MTDQTNDDAARRTRELALSHAVTIASQQQVQKYSGEIVVNVAKQFEAYLNGDTPQ